MAERINDGGPAFPVPGLQHDEAFNGMTLRDYFAAHEPIHPTESIGVMLAEELIGRKIPNPDTDSDWSALAVVQFWADAEAAYRYMRADAMLRAREGGAA